jgi:hypothetical protein
MSSKRYDLEGKENEENKNRKESCVRKRYKYHKHCSSIKVEKN